MYTEAKRTRWCALRIVEQVLQYNGATIIYQILFNSFKYWTLYTLLLRIKIHNFSIANIKIRHRQLHRHSTLVTSIRLKSFPFPKRRNFSIHSFDGYWQEKWRKIYLRFFILCKRVCDLIYIRKYNTFSKFIY